MVTRGPSVVTRGPSVSLVVIRGHSWTIRGHSWSTSGYLWLSVVTRGPSVVTRSPSVVIRGPPVVTRGHPLSLVVHPWSIVVHPWSIRGPLVVHSCVIFEQILRYSSIVLCKWCRSNIASCIVFLITTAFFCLDRHQRMFFGYILMRLKRWLYQHCWFLFLSVSKWLCWEWKILCRCVLISEFCDIQNYKNLWNTVELNWFMLRCNISYTLQSLFAFTLSLSNFEYSPEINEEKVLSFNKFCRAYAL